ncbi:MAG: TatD family hydrolase [Desulfuromonadales bacterium]|nr:TatD family hydrolase [Desulfuromonadales bacterium]
MLIDTHCHLNFKSLAEHLPEILQRGKENGVNYFLVPGVKPAEWSEILKLSKDYNNIFPAFGLHPLYADQYNTSVESELKDLLKYSVAVGEIGLDYMVKSPSREVQIEVFKSQLDLAIERDLPIIIHCRKAFKDLLSILYRVHSLKLRGVIHAFSGSPEIATEMIKLGFKIGIAGTVTWKGALKPVRVLQNISIDDIVLETDSPNLSPESFRGIPNEPAHLREIVEVVAEIKNISVQQVADITTQNAVSIFGLKI